MNTPIFRCGKKPASKPKVTDLHFSTYRLTAPVPLPPIVIPFGNLAMPDGSPWGMLGNDTVGNCVIAWSMHRTMLVAALVGKTIKFSTASALQTYSDATGFDPSQTQDDGSNPTDQGTNMADFVTFWQKTGILDDSGNRHTIRASVRLNQANLTELQEAAVIFKMPGLGIMFPDFAMTQTQNGQPWSWIDGQPTPTEGHCFGLQGDDGKYYDGNTWNMNQLIEPPFLLNTIDEAWAVVSDDELNAGGTSPDGFDMEQLLADATAVSQM
jgi:hypothetical protein